MKYFKQIFIFISLWLGFPFLISILNLPGRNLLLIYIPLIFSFYHLIQTLRYFFKKNLKSSTRSFIITILFILITIKIEYYFYNWVIHIILILVGLYFLKPIDNFKTAQPKTIELFLLGLNFILLITSNNWILNKLNDENKPWASTIEWSDFKGFPDKNSKMDAIITTTIKYKVNKLYNYPSAVMSAYMIPNKSWKKEISNLELRDKLLNHERGHFNIVEAHMRFAQDSLQKFWVSDPDKIEKIIKFYINEKDGAQNDYDSITSHGSNIENQIIWDEKIQAWLNL